MNNYPIGMVGSPTYNYSPPAGNPMQSGPGYRKDFRSQPWYRPGMENGFLMSAFYHGDPGARAAMGYPTSSWWANGIPWNQMRKKKNPQRQGIPAYGDLSSIYSSPIGGVQNFPNMNNYAAQYKPMTQQGLSDIYNYSSANDMWKSIGLI